MKQFIISYIEDNHLGVYTKEILVEDTSIIHAFNNSISKYPTLFGIKEIHGQLADNWIKYYSHESQDAIQQGKKDMFKNISNI